MANDILNMKEIIHEKCGNKHIDEGEYGLTNHVRHLCYFCDEFFHDAEPGIGI